MQNQQEDPNAHKRNMSSFLIYANANRYEVKAAYPDANFGVLASCYFLVILKEKGEMLVPHVGTMSVPVPTWYRHEVPTFHVYHFKTKDSFSLIFYQIVKYQTY